MSTVFNPTFVFGVGRLGTEVVSRLRDELPTQGDASAANSVLAVLELAHPEEMAEREEIVARVKREDPLHTAQEMDEGGLARLKLPTEWDELHEKQLTGFTLDNAWRLLRLSHFLDYSSAENLLPPRFSVFLVADVGEEEVRHVLNPLIEVVGRTLLSRFSHIFNPRGPEGEAANFGVYPILMLGGIRDEKTPRRGEIWETLKTLTQVAKESREWWSVADAQLDTLRPCVSRAVLLDDQTTKYVLERAEIVSSILGFLTIALFSGDLSEAGPEDHTWALAQFLGGSEEEWARLEKGDDDPPIFGTFGVATLDVAQELVTGYVQNRLALSIVESMRPKDPAASQLMLLRPLWSPEEIDNRLQGYGRSTEDEESPTSEGGDDEPWSEQRSVADSIEKRLRELSENLKGRCEPIEDTDSPERITNDKYSWPWFEDLAKKLSQTCQDIEEGDLPRAGDEVDRRGLSLARERFNELRDGVNRWVWAEPQGWHRARQHLHELRTEAKKQVDGFELEPNLPDLPDTDPVRQAVLEVRHQARTWPRRWRVIFTGAFVAFVLTAIFHFMPKWLYVRFVYQNDTYIKEAKAKSLLDKGKRWAARGIDKAKRLLRLKEASKRPAPEGYVVDTRYDPPGWLANPMLFKLPPHKTAAHLVVDRPYVFVWLYLLFAVLIWIYLRSYLRRRREEMDRSIWFLKNRIEELVVGMSNSVREYFGKRVKFSRDLWIRRLLNRIEDQAGEEMERLDVVDRALLQLRHKYREAQKRLGVRYVGPEEDEEDLSGVHSALSDPIYRRLLDADTLINLYEDTVGEEANRLTDFFEGQKKDAQRREEAKLPEWRESAPFADEYALELYIQGVLEEAGADLNVLERLLDEEGEKKETALQEAMQRFFAQLTGKLSHSVELSTPASGHQVTRLLLLPKDRLEAFEGVFSQILDKAGLQRAHGLRMDRVGSWDAERLHLFVGYSRLRLGDFRWVRPSSGAPPRSPAKSGPATSGPLKTSPTKPNPIPDLTPNRDDDTGGEQP